MKKNILKFALGITVLAFSANTFAQVYTFTPCGATGRLGPTQGQVNATYTGPNTLTGAVTINTPGIQEWTVPTSGAYSIVATGAGEAFSTGVELSGEFTLTAGQTIYIAAGQQASASGGHGGTFVASGASLAGSTPLIVGGGGGGNYGGDFVAANQAANFGITAGNGNTGFGGTAGNGGQTNTNNTTYGGGGGGGFYTNGVNTSSYGNVGVAFVNGAQGGDQSLNSANTDGGFGGGGAGFTNIEPAGGGGYSGGGGGGYEGQSNVGGLNRYGGGGASFNSGVNQVNIGANIGDGQVIITQLCTPLNISVLPNINVCEGDTVTITGTSTGVGTVTWDNGIANGVSFPNPTAGVTTYTSSSTDGNDCVAQIVVTVSAPTASTDVQVACDTYTWIDAITYTASNNSATVTLTNAAGCDSIVTLDLTINVSPNAGTNNTLTTCNNDTTTDLFTLLAGADAGGTWSPVLTSGTGVFDPATDASATYTYTVNGIAPCANATATVIVTVNQTTAGTDVQVACDTYTWIDANTYTTNNNTATFTLTNAAGCDSIVTLDLTINVSPNAGTNNTLATCNNDTTTDLFTLLAGADAGGTWSPVLTSGTGVFDPATDASATYTYTVNGIAPCANTTATVIVTVNQTTAGTDVQVACDTYTWIDAITYTASNNTATFTLTNAAGCDSIVTLDLTINVSPFVLMNPFNENTICETHNSINLPAVTPTGGTYSGTGVSGNMFDPSMAGVGSHYVVYTYTDGNNCAVSDSSLIEVVSCVGINENSPIGQVNIYPNPTNDIINISMANNSTPLNFTLMSIDGKVVYRLNNVTDKKVTIDISNNSKGIYFLRIGSATDYKVYKVLKQ